MREKLAELESSAGKANNGYGEKSKTSTALGRYQILEPSLIDAKWKNADGSWTEKAKEAGVTNNNEFRTNRDAQEKALTDVLQRYSEQLKANGALSKNRYDNSGFRRAAAAGHGGGIAGCRK